MILPSIPAWTELHPAVVHFPVALLPVGWLLVLLGAFRGRAAAGLRVAAALVLTIGAAGAVLAVATGEAAADRQRALTPGAAAVLEQHEELGEATRNVFVALAALYVAGLAVSRLSRTAPPRGVAAGLHAVYLVVFLAAIAVLLQTAALGGELVHRWGVSGLVSAADPVDADGDGDGVRTPLSTAPEP